MAGIFYPVQGSKPGQLVTLTTTPNYKCAQYHHRMPVLIQSADISYWLNSNADEVTPLLQHLPGGMMVVTAEG